MREFAENAPHMSSPWREPAEKPASIGPVGDGAHPMLFAGYQTNPNYLRICWTFFQRETFFLQIDGSLQPQAAAQE